jgi:hypothetical protein
MDVSNSGILDLLKTRLEVEEKLLDKISRFLLLLERKQPGAIRYYRNVCINPTDPKRVIIIFQDLDDTFSREFPSDIVDTLDEPKLVSWLNFVEKETHEDREKKIEEWEQEFIANIQKKRSS